MSEEVVRDTIARLATDAAFRAAVRSDGAATLAGLDLTTDEVASLQALSVNDGGAGAAQLGARLSKSSMFFAGTLSALHLHDVGDSHDPAATDGPGPTVAGDHASADGGATNNPAQVAHGAETGP